MPSRKLTEIAPDPTDTASPPDPTIPISSRRIRDYAHKAAGAPDGIAREASEEIAGSESRVSGIESDMKLLKWITGTNVALTAAVLFRLLTA